MYKNEKEQLFKSKGMGGICQRICSDYHTTVSQSIVGIYDSAGIAARGFYRIFLCYG